MQNVQTLKLSRATLMFPLALVLFEFSVYIGNDLVQPAMLAITQDFGVSSAWAPSSMSFYLLGGACVAWLLGPLSDRLGRKKVLLAGVAFFVLTCLAILLTQNIESFLALRFLQGVGLSMISAVGYAAVQESFEERDAIKVMALMANISLLAPLLGPVVGAFMIDHVSWHWGFIGIAFLAFLSWFGLKAKMPATQRAHLWFAYGGHAFDAVDCAVTRDFGGRTWLEQYAIRLSAVPRLGWSNSGQHSTD